MRPEDFYTIENIRKLKARGQTMQLHGKTHCPHGHEYTPENTYIDNAGKKRCKTCLSAIWKRHQEARNANRRAKRSILKNDK